MQLTMQVKRNEFDRKIFRKICNTKDVALYNIYGFGLWIFKTAKARELWEV